MFNYSLLERLLSLICSNTWNSGVDIWGQVFLSVLVVFTFVRHLTSFETLSHTYSYKTTWKIRKSTKEKRWESATIPKSGDSQHWHFGVHEIHSDDKIETESFSDLLRVERPINISELHLLIQSGDLGLSDEQRFFPSYFLIPLHPCLGFILQTSCALLLQPLQGMILLPVLCQFTTNLD